MASISKGTPTTAKARGPYAKGIEKRAEILEAALEVIARHGYRRTSVRELASAVRLSEPGLLHYFGSKEKLFEEVLRARDTADLQRFAAENIDVIDGFLAIIRHNADVPGLVQLYSTFSAEAGDPQHSAHEYFTERYRQVHGQLRDCIRERQEDGRIDARVDAGKAATILIALSDGLQIMSQFDPDMAPAELVEYAIGLFGPAGNGGAR